MIHWFSFFIGAPVWGSLAVGLFILLLAVINRTPNRDPDPDVISIREWRTRKTYVDYEPKDAA